MKSTRLALAFTAIISSTTLVHACEPLPPLSEQLTSLGQVLNSRPFQNAVQEQMRRSMAVKIVGIEAQAGVVVRLSNGCSINGVPTYEMTENDVCPRFKGVKVATVCK